jgi:hypothetical protein
MKPLFLIQPRGNQKEPTFGQCVAREVQQRNCPCKAGEIVQMVAAKELRHAEHRHRDRRVLRGRVAEQRSPVVLLESEQDRQHRADYANRDRDHTEPERRAAIVGDAQPAVPAAAQREVGRIEYDAGEQHARRTTAARVRTRKPLVERDEAELRAEANEQRDTGRPRQKR